VAYTAEQKATAVAVIHQHGGMTNAALDAVEALLGKRVSTSTLHGWLSKTEPKSEPKSEKPKAKSETSATDDMLAESDLSPQRLAFVDAYFELNFNATKAAIKAGYSERSAYSQGQRLLKNADVAAEIKRRLSDRVMGEHEAYALMSDIARGTIEDFISIRHGGLNGWQIDLDKAQKAGKLHLVKKIKEHKDGTIEVELYAKDAALRDIGKHHGLWKDGVEINIDLTLLVAVVDAIRAARLEPSDIFNSLLVELDHAQRADAGATDSGTSQS
jgi:phage terminase small subunit